MFPVDRETLMLLPESVLLGLFPQGLVLSRPASWEGGDDGVFAVDVSKSMGAAHGAWELHRGMRSIAKGGSWGMSVVRGYGRGAWKRCEREAGVDAARLHI